MKVCLLSTSERGGGAAVAANRLMKALQSAGVSVKMVVRDKQTSDENVISINCSWISRKINQFRFIWERVVIWKTNGFRRHNLFAVSIANTGTDISNLPEVQEADVIHLHWVNQGFLSLKDIKRLIALGKPIVWTMHDMWPCTGICHYARECVNYQTECRNCPLLTSSRKNDFSSRVFNEKRQLNYGKVNFVTCSQWLGNQAVKSKLFEGVNLISIPNTLNTSLFVPSDKTEARKHFKLPAEKHLLLFGAAKISDSRKGGEYFFEALKLLAAHYPLLNEQIELVFVGASTLQMPDEIPYKAHFMGYISKESEIATLYNAIDTFVIPSLEDNLPNTIMESLACGTPVVGFDIGGIPEMVDHKTNGYIAKYKDSDDLMNGMHWVLFEADAGNISKNARDKVMMSYGQNVVTMQYMQLYNQIKDAK